MRHFALFTTTGLLATLLVGCESSDYPTEAPCTVSNETTGEVTEFWPEDYDNSTNAAVAACTAYGISVNGGSEGTDVPADDEDATNIPETGNADENGAITVSIAIDGAVMTWVNNDGVRICLEKGRMGGDVNPDNTWFPGYGEGGQADWSSEAYSVDQYRYQSTLYVCTVTALQPIDDNGLFVKNYWHGDDNVDDWTNWARVYAGDKYACVTGEDSNGNLTFGLGFTIQYDREDYWRVQTDTSGACSAVTDG